MSIEEETIMRFCLKRNIYETHLNRLVFLDNIFSLPNLFKKKGKRYFVEESEQ